jgi:hypothetical protein
VTNITQAPARESTHERHPDLSEAALAARELPDLTVGDRMEFEDIEKLFGFAFGGRPA